MIAQQMASAAPAGPKPSAAPNIAALANDKSPRARILLSAMRIIYSNPKGFVDIIRNAPNPMQGLAMAAKIVYEKIAKSVKGVPPETIQKLYPVVVQKLSPTIVYILVELAVAAGVKGLDAAAAGAPGGAGAAPARPAMPPAPQPGAPMPQQPNAQPVL